MVVCPVISYMTINENIVVGDGDACLHQRLLGQLPNAWYHLSSAVARPASVEEIYHMTILSTVSPALTNLPVLIEQYRICGLEDVSMVVM